jgi:integral membrane sensor domain MASE1
MNISWLSSAVAAIFVLTFVLNLFFGYFRARTRKYSLKWFLCIHLPIPVIFVARLYAHLDMRFIPVFLVAAIAGQIVGGKLEI